MSTNLNLSGKSPEKVNRYTLEVVANKYDMERTGIKEYKKSLDIKGLKVLEEKTLIN